MTFRETDATRREDMAALIQHAKDTYGRVDVLVSNAGVGPFAIEQSVDVNEIGIRSTAQS